MNTLVSALVNKYSGDTGITYSTDGQKFKIPNENAKSFYFEYCDMVYAEMNRDGYEDEEDEKCEVMKSSIYEHSSTGDIPLMVNILLKFRGIEGENEERELYDDKFIYGCIRVVQLHLIDTIEISHDRHELYCSYFEAVPHHDESLNLYVTKFRLYFPYVVLNNEYLLTTFSKRLVNAFELSNVFKFIDAHPVGGWSDVVSVQGSAFPMYGCHEEDSRCPLKYMDTVCLIDETYEEEGVKNFDLDVVFIHGNHKLFWTNKMTNEDIEEQGYEHDYWLPLYTSPYYWERVSTIKKSAIEKAKPKSASLVYEENSDDMGKVALQLLSIIDVSAYNTKPTWIDIGKALYNIGNGSDRELNLWIEYSSMATVKGRDAQKCSDLWPTFAENPYDVKTIAWYAKSTAPEEYKKWHDSWIEGYMRSSLSLVEDDVAKAVYHMYWLDYVTGNSTTKDWFYFDGTRLVREGAGNRLRNAICNEVKNRYEKLAYTIDGKALSEDTDIVDKNSLAEYSKMIRKLVKKLGTRQFLENVIYMTHKYFYVANLSSLMDSNMKMTGWKNFVIECCGGHAYIRTGKPQDYITKSTGTVIKQSMNEKNQRYKDVMRWLGQVFVDAEVLDFFLKDCAAFLLGGNPEKRFRIFYGPDGGNSKSMVVHLLQRVFGDYCIDFPVNMITVGRNRQSGPTPELDQADKTHLAIVSEPSPNDLICCGKIKKLTGGDRYFSRSCNENGGSKAATFKLILMCNSIPETPGADEAFADRTCVIPFLSKWTKNYPESTADQYEQRRFPIDHHFKDKIEMYRSAFAYIMIKHYERYMNEGLDMPDIVRHYSDQYIQINDRYLSFLRAKITQAYIGDTQEIDYNATLTATEIYPHFKEWFRNANPGMSIPKQSIFTSKMIRDDMLGKRREGRRWIGVRLIMDENDGEMQM